MIEKIQKLAAAGVAIPAGASEQGINELYERHFPSGGVKVKIGVSFDAVLKRLQGLPNVPNRPEGVLSVVLKADGTPDVSEGVSAKGTEWVRIVVNHKAADDYKFVLWGGDAKAIEPFVAGSQGNDWVFSPVNCKIHNKAIVLA